MERLKTIIEIIEKSETTVKITQEHIEKVKKYLFMLDLIVDCSERYESGKRAEHTVFSQPGMRYSITKALVYSLMQDEYFGTVSELDKEYIVAKILEDVKGRMSMPKKKAVMEGKFGKITGKFVLYRGENAIVDDIQYQNVEHFLCDEL